ncbi:MAG: putative Enoyl-CoA hydratase [Actinomycetia bacterium]|nr:putative Enoyl-CoA hydratase [Actinomycetes bacterium]
MTPRPAPGRSDRVQDAVAVAARMRGRTATAVVGALAGEPAIAVAGPAEAVADVVSAARHLPVVMIAVDDGSMEPAALGADLALTTAGGAPAPWISDPDGRALDGLLDRIGSFPSASVVLAQLLRLGKDLDPHAGLTAESLAYATLQSGPEFAAWLRARGDVSAPGPGDPVTLVRDGDVLRVVLDRPERHNAYDIRTRDGVVAAFELVAADPSIRRVELRGNGPTFSSGGDLSEFGTVADPVLGHLVRSSRFAAAAMLDCAVPIDAYVHGRCLGAGVELMAFADRVVAWPDSTFELPEVAMGLVPGAGGTVSVVRRIGRHRTAYLALTGERLDARRALAWGLVDEITAD